MQQFSQDTGENFGDGGNNKGTDGNSTFGARSFAGGRGRGGRGGNGGSSFDGRGRGGPNTTAGAEDTGEDFGDGENNKETGGNSTFGARSFSGGRGRGGCVGDGDSSFGGRGRGGPNTTAGGVNRFGTGNNNSAAATGANTAPLGIVGGGRGGGGGSSLGGFGGRGGGRGGGANRFGSGQNGEGRFGSKSGGAGGSDNHFGAGGRAGGADRGGNDRGGDRFGGCNDDQGGNRFPFPHREECQKPRFFETEEERARAQSHIPVFRTVEEVFAEDVKVSYQYKGIREEDEEVEVTGLPEEAHQQVLDDWKDAAFEPKLQENIKRATYMRPRKIQSLTIPLIMDGHDIKGHAETGSGKSAAFLLPIINQIIVKKKNAEYTPRRICPYALIIEPTRELAIQLFEQACKLAQDTGTTVSVAYGKFKRRENIRDISVRGCDILIGTPGRLVDFFSDKLLEFDNMKILVLDEADQLLEDTFARELRHLTKLAGWPKNEERQTLLFSATFPQEVQQWADEWMRKQNVFVSNQNLVSANTRVIQQFMNVTRADKNTILLKLLKDEEEEAKKENPENPVVKRTMVFVKMKRAADVVSTFLNVHQLKSTTINGDRPQKLREEALNEFRQGKHNIVVTTDVCARGIDIKDLDHVINLDLPTEYVTYVHRIGRTGRLKEGTATSFFDPFEDMELTMDLVKGCKSAGQEPPDWLVDASEGKSTNID